MAKNIAITMVERLDRLERAQMELAAAKVAELAAQGIEATIEEVTQAAVSANVIRETPTGVCNGVNKVFTLASAPIIGTEQVFLSGMLLLSGTVNDYVISGSTITMNYSPDSDDTIKVNYQYIVI